MRFVLFLLTVGLLFGCVTSTTTRLANNTVRIDASAAPACGRSGALRLVNRMAAVETLRFGYDKFIITNSQLQNNVRVVGYNTRTTGTYGFGAFNANTYATPIIGGSRDATVIVVMFKENERQGGNALDARQALGPDWQTVLADGVPKTCN